MGIQFSPPPPSGGEPADADLTAIAGLSPSNDDVIQRKAGAWTNRTPAQLKTDLGVTAALAPLGVILKRVAVQTIAGSLTWTAVSFTDIEREDGDLVGAPAITSITIPAGGAGLYDFTFGATWEAGAGMVAARLVVDGAVVAYSALPAGLDANVNTPLATQVYCDVGDVVAVGAFSSTAGRGLGVVDANGWTAVLLYPRFTMYRVAA